jgi:hypothetical protein
MVISCHIKNIRAALYAIGRLGEVALAGSDWRVNVVFDDGIFRVLRPRLPG